MADETIITAPMPGVFYRSPEPGAEPFFEEGDHVEAGDVLGLVGVMKNFHDVEAETTGTLVRFLVEDEAEIEAGEPLVALEPA